MNTRIVRVTAPRRIPVTANGDLANQWLSIGHKIACSKDEDLCLIV